MKRYGELDSLRGLAAIIVVFYHLLNITVENWSKMQGMTWKLFYYSPIRLIWLGHQSVILFFVLSGFVLSIPLYGTELNSNQYSQYFVKRICRIYIPFITAIGIAIITRILMQGHIHLGDWWSGHITWDKIVEHASLISMFDQDQFDPVVWSLVHEMRISLLFPFVILIMKRLNWKQSLLFGWGLSVCGILLHYLTRAHVDRMTNYFSSFHYIFMFVVGALLYKHRNAITSFYHEKVSFPFKVVLVLLFYVTYGYSIAFEKINFWGRYIGDWLTLIGSVLLIVFALSEKGFSSFLHFKPIVFLGKISYSIYLLHMIILLALANLYLGIWPTWLIWAACLSLTLILSTIYYHLIEANSIKLGRQWSGAIGSRKLMVKRKQTNTAGL